MASKHKIRYFIRDNSRDNTRFFRYVGNTNKVEFCVLKAATGFDTREEALHELTWWIQRGLIPANAGNVQVVDL